MPTTSRIRERASLARLTIGLVKTVLKGRARTRPIGGSVGSLLISGAVLIGQADGKPKTASDIARYLGVPRATAQRKLNSLVRQGEVYRHGGRYCMTADPHAPYAYVDDAVRLIQNAAKALSR